jgi:DNA-binding MarR family transcriptional regulator
MADINSGDGADNGATPLTHASGKASATAPVGAPRDDAPDENLVTIVELLFFAYRDFTGEADAVLAKFGFGRAHHRVLHFVSRNPGIRVADLLDILKITKQSLARVLKQLVDEGYIEQMAGMSDRRERRLYVTFAGEQLARELMALQAGRVAEALAMAGSGARGSAERFLCAMVAPAERERVQALLQPRGTPGPEI